MELLNSLNIVYLGNTQRLRSIGGDKVVDTLSTSGLRFIKDLCIADVLITTRWWDPLVTLLKLIRPKIVTIFVSDGHFSALNLNKQDNKRHGKNIFEMKYCDIYLLPDDLSLSAVAEYPGSKLLYQPNYLEKPNISFVEKREDPFDIIFIYGNDPFFNTLFREKLITLVTEIDEIFRDHLSIAHIVPTGKNGKFLSKHLPKSANLFVGLKEGKDILSKDTIYICTPSTIVWQLMSISGKVAVIDIYKDNICFPTTIKRISMAKDMKNILAKSEKSWRKGFDVVEKNPATDEILPVINKALGINAQIHRINIWGIVKQYKLRDFLSSFSAVISRI